MAGAQLAETDRTGGGSMKHLPATLSSSTALSHSIRRSAYAARQTKQNRAPTYHHGATSRDGNRLDRGPAKVEPPVIAAEDYRRPGTTIGGDRQHSSPFVSTLRRIVSCGGHARTVLRAR